MPTTVSRETVEETIIEAIVELGPEREELSRDATLESLDIDSLDLVEIAQILEEEHGVKLTTDDADRLRSLGDVFDLVWERAQQ
jgi:acyl carrier protein